MKKLLSKCIIDRIIYAYNCIRLFLRYSVTRKNEIKIPLVEFYTDVETVDMIVKRRMSLSRYGDGEFKWMNNESISSFQNYSPELSLALRKSFMSTDPNLLIGIPIGIFDSTGCNFYARIWWKMIRNSTYQYLAPFVDLSRKYANASMSRPYIDYSDREFSRKAFENLKRIWDGRDICFIEGEKTKMGMGNDLYSNAKTIKRIICPSENAFSRIGEIEQAIKDNIDKDCLLLGALGPTASILAVEMCKIGFQFIDIGHVDVEYMWYLNHSILRDPIPGKYVNESGKKADLMSNLYEDEDAYARSIVCSVI